MRFLKYYEIFVVVLLSTTIASIGSVQLRKYPNQAYFDPKSYYAKQEAASEEAQDLTKIPGEAGVDYPIYHEVPQTRFTCSNVPAVPGMYADVETGCQAYHVCHDGREGDQGASFLCSNGTLFNQEEFTCDWWYKVDCRRAPELYRLNADVETNPYTPKKQHSGEESFEDYRSSYSTKYHQAQPQPDPLPGLKYYRPQSYRHY